MSEMVIILGVALLVFGPQKLPEVAKSIAKGLRDLRRASDDLRSQVMVDLDDDRPPTLPAAKPFAPATEPAPAIEGSELAGAHAPPGDEEDEPRPRAVEGAVARDEEGPAEAPAAAPVADEPRRG